MEFIKCFIFILTLLISLFSVVFSTYQIPVLAWSNSKISTTPPALNPHSTEEFISLISDQVEKGNAVVIFSENSLGADDFKLKDENNLPVMRFLSGITNSNYEHVYWPGVDSPIDQVKQLPNAVVREELVADNNDLESLISNRGEIVIVRFDTAPDADRKDTIKANDALIEKLFNGLVEKHPDVLAVFTGERSSWPEKLSRSRRAGETSQNFATPHFIMNVDLPFSITANGRTIEINNNFKASETEGGVPRFKLSNADDYLEFVFTSDLSGYWYLTEINVNNATSVSVQEVYAPVGFSYHCTDFNVNGDLVAKMEQFQVQYFANAAENKKFGDAYDCVGFTSVPIWSGILVTFILGLILAAGLIMLMDIKTMDRFDDPKGKTITVNVAE